MGGTGIRQYLPKINITIDNEILFLSQCQHFENQIYQIFSGGVTLLGEISNIKN